MIYVMILCDFHPQNQSERQVNGYTMEKEAVFQLVNVLFVGIMKMQIGLYYKEQISVLIAGQI